MTDTSKSFGAIALNREIPVESLAAASYEFEKRFDQLNQTMDTIDSKASNLMGAGIAVLLAVLGFAVLNEVSECAKIGLLFFIISQVSVVLICLWIIKVTEERVSGFIPKKKSQNETAASVLSLGLNFFYAAKITKLEDQCETLNKRANKKADLLMGSQIIFVVSALALFAMALTEIYL